MDGTETVATTTTAVERPTLDALTGIRAVAAGWVVLHHFREPMYSLLPALRPTERWLQSGFLGVEVFFVLSGFIISYTYAGSVVRAATHRRFLLARFARIYPAHLVTLVLTGLLVVGAAAAGIGLNSGANYGVGNLLGNLALLQAFPGVVAWNPPSWSISCEAAAYLVFPLLAAGVVRLGRRSALVCAAAVLVVELLVLWVIGRLTVFSALALPSVWTRIAGEFTLGCLLWAVWRHGVVAGRRWDVLAVAAVAATGSLLAVVDPSGPAAFLVLPFLALFVFACAGATGPVHRFLASRPMCWLGRISYSVYLTHFLVIVVLAKLVPRTGLADGPVPVRVLAVAGWLLLVCAAGAVLHHAVEEPARRLIRRAGESRLPSLRPRTGVVG